MSTYFELRHYYCKCAICCSALTGCHVFNVLDIKAWPLKQKTWAGGSTGPFWYLMLVRPKNFIWTKLVLWIFRNIARFFIFMVRLYIAFTRQSVLGQRSGLWPVLLCLIPKKGLCPSSGDINRLMMIANSNDCKCNRDQRLNVPSEARRSSR
jgi:hypothetical protein